MSDKDVLSQATIESIHEPKKQKKTDYRRLWRNAKIREMKTHNFIESMWAAIPKHFKNPAEVTEFIAFIEDLKKHTFKKLD